MAIVLGTFTSSSTKLLDLSYYEQSCLDGYESASTSLLNHRKKNEIFHLSQRARDLDYVVNKLTARSKDLISSYINRNVGVVG